VCAGAGVGKTQLVKGKLACLPEEMMSLGISFNYFTDVVSFQKVNIVHLVVSK
jgi:dynein heavy chain